MGTEKCNINMPGATEMEQRLIALIRTSPKGIPDKDLNNKMPDLKPLQRAEMINKLLSQGHIELCKQAGSLVYRFKDSTKVIKGASTNEEKIVYKIIEEEGNKGIWIGDIRKKSNLVHSQLVKILKNFETKQVIKVMKSATTNRKMHLLYQLEPDISITGSVWFQDKEMETEFIDILSQQCYRFLEEKREEAESRNAGPITARNAMLVSSEEVRKFISNLGISKVELSINDIEMLLNLLIYDGKIDKIFSGDNRYLYKSIKPLMNSPGLMTNPCGLCPVRKDCNETGTFSSIDCQYLKEWLE